MKDSYIVLRFIIAIVCLFFCFFLLLFFFFIVLDIFVGSCKRLLYPITHIFLSSEPPHEKTNKMTVRPAKTPISLGIRPV